MVIFTNVHFLNMCLYWWYRAIPKTLCNQSSLSVGFYISWKKNCPNLCTINVVYNQVLMSDFFFFGWSLTFFNVNRFRLAFPLKEQNKTNPFSGLISETTFFKSQPSHQFCFRHCPRCRVQKQSPGVTQVEPCPSGKLLRVPVTSAGSPWLLTGTVRLWGHQHWDVGHQHSGDWRDFSAGPPREAAAPKGCCLAGRECSFVEFPPPLPSTPEWVPGTAK